MDFRRLERAMAARGGPGGNKSEPLSLTELQPNILDALIPGYSVISRYAQAVLGVDISIFVTVVMVLLAVTKGGQYLANRLERALRYVFVSSVYIEEHDDLFDMVMAWLAKHQGPVSRRSVRAKTQRGPKVQAEMEDSYDSEVDDVLDENGMFDYNKWSARMPPRFEPYYGRNFLRHNGNWYLIKRSRRQTDRMSISYNHQSDDIVQIDCLGRSIAPIEDFLRSVKTWSLMRMRHTTTIRHPTPKDSGRRAGPWSRTTSRPSRPIDTVILDAKQKASIIKDMNDYLHPSSPKWYATRGIPYRRGYLFYGPPGTGKTSLSFALAGIFGLEIYVIALQEPSLTEGDLMQLFNALPRRCIVLLEDVDAAGLLRDANNGKSTEGPRRKGRKGGMNKNGDADKTKIDEHAKKSENNDALTLRDLVRELKTISGGGGSGGGGGGGSVGGGGGGGRMGNAQVQNNGQPTTNISLSGLLNVIDGVATHEGRVLIMTTNHPEKLDPALIRPGRVDRRVEFSMAMRDQIRELFVRMFTSSEPSIDTGSNGSMKSLNNDSAVNGSVKHNRTSPNHAVSLAPSELEELAVKFAEIVPDGTYTPAEIQNHLMRYKNDPAAAVKTASDWLKELEEEKEKQHKAREYAEGDQTDDE